MGGTSHGDGKGIEQTEQLREPIPPPYHHSEEEHEEETSDSDLRHDPPIHKPSPWNRNEKADLRLPTFQVNVHENTLTLEANDYTPIELGWGYCLLGFFAGRFPGKEAVQTLAKSFTRTAKISFHPNGWIVFRFATQEDMEIIRMAGPYAIFGTPLILCPLPPEFRFNCAPSYKFPVWASLPNLPLELWNPNAIGKIASLVGSPIEVDYRTLAKNHIDGPRFHVLVDALSEPLEAINLKLHNGNTFLQQIKFEYYPKICLNCGRVGHVASLCHGNILSKPNIQGPRNSPRGRTNFAAKNAGQEMINQPRGRQPGRQSKHNRYARTRSKSVLGNQRKGRNSKPPGSKQVFVPIRQVQEQQTQPQNANTHIRFKSPVSAQPTKRVMTQQHLERNLATNSTDQPHKIHVDGDSLLVESSSSLGDQSSSIGNDVIPIDMGMRSEGNAKELGTNEQEEAELALEGSELPPEDPEELEEQAKKAWNLLQKKLQELPNNIPSGLDSVNTNHTGDIDSNDNNKKKKGNSDTQPNGLNGSTAGSNTQQFQ